MMRGRQKEAGEQSGWGEKGRARHRGERNGGMEAGRDDISALPRSQIDVLMNWLSVNPSAIQSLIRKYPLAPFHLRDTASDKNITFTPEHFIALISLKREEAVLYFEDILLTKSRTLFTGINSVHRIEDFAFLKWENTTGNYSSISSGR